MSEILTDGGCIPLSSLRLIVPPVQLVSAALWEIVKQGAVMYFGLLEEFVTTVLESVPELLTYTERAQLVMGLRAKVVLELCRNDGFANPQAIQPHLSRINTFITNQDKDTSGTEVKTSVTNFLKLVHTLVDDQCQRDIFYQKIFPTVFGPKYDSALQTLMKKFLLSLQKLLPVPDLEQTSLWLSLSPSILKECVDFMNQPEPLNTLIQHHKHHGNQVPQAVPSSGDDCILSSLSYHLPNVDDDGGDSPVFGSIRVSQDWQRDHCLGSESAENSEENLKEMSSELKRNVERNGEQYVDDLTEDQGASVEVILQSMDESESSDEDDVDRKRFRHLKSSTRASAINFKCLICGQAFGSFSKLRKHKMSHSVFFKNRVGQSKPASKSSFLEKIDLHPKPETCNDNNTFRSQSEAGKSLGNATTHDPPSPPNSEQTDDISYSLICNDCGKVFTYPKSFDKHQKVCAARSKRQAKTVPECSTSLAPCSKPNPVDKTSETETGPSGVLPGQPVSSDSPTQPTCKRSSRVKQCSVCGKVFTCSSDLTRHIRCHAEQSPYFCTHCGRDFDSYEDCETHQEGDCEVLNQRSQDNFSRRENTTNQETVAVSGGILSIVGPPIVSQAPQAAEEPLTCHECDQIFTYYKSFEKHQSKCSKRPPQRKKAANSNHLVIKACNFRSARNASARHGKVSSVTEESETAGISADQSDGSRAASRIIKCTMCDKNFSKILPMKRHYSKLHKVRGPYPCPVCKTAFVRLCELVRHLENKKLYQCAACKKCFTSPGLVSDHERVHTVSVTPSICETCGRSFKTLAYLILHQNTHRERSPSVCSYCGKQFSTKDCLKAHMVRHTGGYPCPVCGKKFNQRTYLKWHLYKHTGQEPYLCDTCGKGWPSAAQLKVHMIQHTEERPFKCDDCGASYKRRSHLMAHRRAKHIRLRPFVCEVCSKTFRLNSELKKHMMVHSGERPFTCPRCGKTFTRKSRLREHRENACL